jgi:predicted Rossmann fold flavoprotein
LQISSYWQPGEFIDICLLPEKDILALLKQARVEHPKRSLAHILGEYFPKRLLEVFLNENNLSEPMGNLSDNVLEKYANSFQQWQIKPNGTEGYRTAEVTLGGIDCNAISSKTMEVIATSNLYFIGEVLDVTGWLGGYNFQWAWSSGWAAGQVV